MLDSYLDYLDEQTLNYHLDQAYLGFTQDISDGASYATAYDTYLWHLESINFFQTSDLIF